MEARERFMNNVERKQILQEGEAKAAFLTRSNQNTRELEILVKEQEISIFLISLQS